MADTDGTLKGLKEQISKLGKAVTEAQGDMSTMVDVQQQVAEILETVKITTEGLTGAYKNLDGVGQTVAEGLAYISSITQLVAMDNEALASSMVKIQSAMGIVSSLRTFTEGFESLEDILVLVRTAMQACDMSLLSDSIALVTAPIIKMNDALGEMKSGLDIGKDTIEEFVEANEDLEVVLEQKENILKEHEEKVTKFNLWQFLFRKKYNARRVKEEEEALKQKQKKERILTIEFNKLLQSEEKQKVEGLLEEQKKLEGGLVIARNSAAEQFEISKDISKSQEERNDASSKYQEFVNEELRLARELGQVEKQLSEIEQERDERKKNAQTAEEKAAEMQKLIDVQKKLEADERQRAIKEEQNWYLQHQLKKKDWEIRKEESAAKIALLEEELMHENLTQDQRIAKIKEYNAALEASSLLEQEIAKAKVEIEAKKLKAFQDANEASGKILRGAENELAEHTVAGKAVNAAATTVETLKAATGAYSAYSSIPFVGPVLGAGAAAVALKAGYDNVRAIYDTDVPGESGGGGKASMPSTSSISEMAQMPSMPDVDQPIMETHNNMNALDEEMLNQSTKVYVTEQDISQVQTRVKTVEHSTAF